MTDTLHGRIGFEVELLAPRGASRKTLALELARSCDGLIGVRPASGGRIRPVWHHDSEPSLVPGLGQFLHLTQGFEVLRPSGELVATLVDDVTLVAELDPRARPEPGWHRLLTDDPRLLWLLAEQSDPGGTVATALDATAALWRTGVQRFGDIFRLDDASGATIALAAPQGGERERPCEIVTPPLTTGHAAALEEVLRPARDLGFTVPVEAAVHLHVDGAPFRQAPALANVIRLFAHWREPLRDLLGTNPACRRLAPLPAELVAAASGSPSYEQLQHAASLGGLTKFFDVNLTQVLTSTPVRDTVEVRILPGSIDAASIVQQAALVEGLLQRCLDPEPVAPPSGPDSAGRDLLRLAAGDRQAVTVRP